MFLIPECLILKPSDTEIHWSDTHSTLLYAHRPTHAKIIRQPVLCTYNTRGACWESGVPAGSVLLPVVSHYAHQIDTNCKECSLTGTPSELT